MAIKTLTISDISGGWAESQLVGKKNTYNSSIAIDPSLPIAGIPKASGAICPVVYSKFSGANLTGYPMWIINDQKNTTTYVYCSDGKILTYDSSLSSETVLTTLSGTGNGGAYYNNYLYFVTGTNVASYGPLNGTPTLNTTFWSGLGLTALTNTTYPSMAGISIPNHACFVHSDNSLYICDVSQGQGCLNKISTTKGTYEGDTNFGSAYASLLLPYGFLPIAVTNYLTDIVVACIQTTDSTINQGKAALFVWNPIQATFYKGPIYLPDTLVTGINNVNGVIRVWGGNTKNGVNLYEYTGGDSVTPLDILADGYPPFPGAVEAYDGSGVVWGGTTTYPAISASVFEYDNGVMHNVVKSTGGGGAVITALRGVIQPTTPATNELVIGWGTGTTYGLDNRSISDTFSAIWRSAVISVGRTFEITDIRIPLGASITAGMSIVPTIYFDEMSTSYVCDTIDNTNFTGRYAIYKGPDLRGAMGQNNFMLDLSFGGTVYLPVIFPIEITIQVHEDEP